MIKEQINELDDEMASKIITLASTELTQSQVNVMKGSLL